MEAGAAVFIIQATNVPTSKVVEIANAALPGIARALGKRSWPMIANVSPSGKLNFIHGGERRGGIKRD